jgi:hypothetical protein
VAILLLGLGIRNAKEWARAASDDGDAHSSQAIAGRGDSKLIPHRRPSVISLIPMARGLRAAGHRAATSVLVPAVSGAYAVLLLRVGRVADERVRRQEQGQSRSAHRLRRIRSKDALDGTSVR